MERSMKALTDFSPALWPLAFYFVAVVVLLVFMLILSALLGRRNRERATDEPYESGIVSTGYTCLRFHAGFYLMAMFFVIFYL
jgi:NADH-quinone oxidoreductase subunit A